jgi:hypothetical protein
MPDGYYPPRAFSKLLYEGVVFGPSRKRWVDFFVRLLHQTIITCGRCGTPIEEIIWTRENVEAFFDLAKAKGRDCLEDEMCRDYDDRVLTCSACNHAAHLARDGPTPDDPSVPF